LIKNRKYIQQIKDFSNLKFLNGISPTDIDGFLDFGGKKFVFIEAKYKTSKLKYGQRLALERLVDSCTDGGIDSIVLVCSHNSDSDIDVSQAIVNQYRYRHKWYMHNKNETIKDFIGRFINK